MPMLHCYVDDFTMEILKLQAIRRGQTPVDLAEAAIENVALESVDPRERENIRARSINAPGTDR